MFVVAKGAVCDFRLGYGKVLSRKSKIIIVNRNATSLHQVRDAQSLRAQSVKEKIWSLHSRTVMYFGNHLCLSMVIQLILWFEWIKFSVRRIIPVQRLGLNLFVVKIIVKRKSIGRTLDIDLGEPLIHLTLMICRQKALEQTKDHLNPIRVLQELENQLPDNAILVGDGGDFVATAAYIVRPRGPLTWLDPGAFGTLGVGAGFALGAKLVRPDANVWIIYGDGALGYSIMEYDTFIRHKVHSNRSIVLLIVSFCHIDTGDLNRWKRCVLESNRTGSSSTTRKYRWMRIGSEWETERDEYQL